MLYRFRELNNLTSVMIVILHDDYTIYTNWGLITNVSRITFAKTHLYFIQIYIPFHRVRLFRANEILISIYVEDRDILFSFYSINWPYKFEKGLRKRDGIIINSLK